MIWTAFTSRPGAALDRVLAGETIIIERRDSMWRLRLRAVKPDEVETLPRYDVWSRTKIRCWPDELWSKAKTRPILISRYGTIEAVLEVLP